MNINFNLSQHKILKKRKMSYFKLVLFTEHCNILDLVDEPRIKHSGFNLNMRQIILFYN